MKLLEQIERINRLHDLIKHRRTGTPEQLARRLNLSTSMIYKLMEELRFREVPIEYSRQFKTYYYSVDFLMRIQAEFRPLNKEEMDNYRGGALFVSLYTFTVL
jgi:predicted DNA-binding transcriptional regulator YafY